MRFRLENGHCDIQKLFHATIHENRNLPDEVLLSFPHEDSIAFIKLAIEALMILAEKNESSRKALFGLSSEQLRLFGEQEVPEESFEKEKENLKHVRGYTRDLPRKRTSSRMEMDCLPEVKEDVFSEGYDENGNILPGFIAIGTEEVKTVENQPSRKFLLRRILHKARRIHPDENGEYEILEPKVIKPVPGSVASASLLAELVSLKIEFDMSEYRIVRRWANEGFHVSPQTVNGWFHECGYMVSALVGLMIADFRKLDVICLDETRLKVTRSAKKQCAVIAGCPGPFEEIRMVLYQFSQTKGVEFLYRLLGKNFHGALMSDGAPVYSNYAGCIKLADFVHARRKFIEAIEIRPGYETFKNLKTAKEQREWIDRSRDRTFIRLLEILGLFHELFETESTLKEKQADPDTILSVRTSTSLPVFETLHTKIRELSGQVARKTKTDTACQYFLKRVNELSEDFRDGRYPIDSNTVERACKMFVLARKNFLFCTSMEGARALCNLFTICQSALKNDLHLERYLTWLFEQLNVKAQTEENLRKMLPYSKELPKELYRNQNA